MLIGAVLGTVSVETRGQSARWAAAYLGLSMTLWARVVLSCQLWWWKVLWSGSCIQCKCIHIFVHIYKVLSRHLMMARIIPSLSSDWFSSLTSVLWLAVSDLSPTLVLSSCVADAAPVSGFPLNWSPPKSSALQWPDLEIVSPTNQHSTPTKNIML